MTFIAHIREEDQCEQQLIDHLKGTAELAANFASIFGAEQHARYCGMLHDIGKYSKEFQRRIKEGGKRCDHSTAGAKEFIQQNPLWGSLLGYTIAGHHSGLQDYGSDSDVEGDGTYAARIKGNIPDYFQCKSEVDVSLCANVKPIPLKMLDKSNGYTFAFFTRMIYSCLVDADYLDTEIFMSNGLMDRTVIYDFNRMQNQLQLKISQFKQDTPLNSRRKKILDNCIDKSQSERGIYRLTVPTGGGKTIASMAFALRHLKHNTMNRIIYVIPFCSIIEQNANVFTDIFGSECVLEHHTNYDFDSYEDDFNGKKKLASENWDMPVVVTTSVQFFESLYANKSSKCRKLHNITNSIIIFDEIQAIPTAYLLACIRSITELVGNYKCSAVLCSATQPKINTYFPEELQPVEICEDMNEIFHELKRAKIMKRGKLSMDALALELNHCHQALVVLNTKKQTRLLYEELEGAGTYHISTFMCPAHRKEVIQTIRYRLKNGLSCIVISTNLIEAGVDLDFPKVYRELAGLDSILQAAGRSNREGKLAYGEVHIFSFEEEAFKIKCNSPYGDYLKKCSMCATEVLEQFEDIFLPEASDAYFTMLYQDLGVERLDEKNVLKMFNDYRNQTTFRFKFKKIAEAFKLIEDDTCSVIVPYNEEAQKMINTFNFKAPNRGELRKLQKYMVNVKRYEYVEMSKMCRIVEIMQDIGILRDEKDYHDDTGLDIYIQLGIAEFF